MSQIKFNPLKGLQKKQKQILQGIIEGKAKYHVIRASRQAGKTHTLENVCTTLALLKPKKKGCFIMPSHNQSKKVYESLLSRIPPALIQAKNNSQDDRHIIYANGTKVDFKSARNYDLIRGNSYDFLIVDEFSFIKEDAWTQAIRPTIAAKKRAKVIMASTPKGKNLFHTFCNQGMNPENELYAHYYMHWSDNKYYDTAEVEDAKRNMPDAIFRQEYEGEFIFGNSTVFGDFTKAQTVKTIAEIVKPQHEYFFGIDWSGTGEDSSVITIMDHMGRVVYVEDISHPNIKTQVERAAEIVNMYNAHGYSETNGLGVTSTQLLQEATQHTYGFHMSNDSKQQLVNSLITSLGEGTIQLPIPEACSELDNQMSTFQVRRTSTGKLAYSHMDNTHDDYVDSLLLANQARLQLSGNRVTIAGFDEDDEGLEDEDMIAFLQSLND